MLLNVVAIVLLLFLVYMCASSFKMARESNEGIEAGIVLGACLALVAFILIICIL